MADMKDVDNELPSSSRISPSTQDDLKQSRRIRQSDRGDNSETTHSTPVDILSEAFSKMEETSQEDVIEFTSTASVDEASTVQQANSKSPAAPESGQVIDDIVAQEITAPDISTNEATFASAEVDSQILATDTSSGKDDLIAETIVESRTPCLTEREQSDAGNMSSESDPEHEQNTSKDAVVEGHSAPTSVSDNASSNSNMLSNITASSLLGSIATMIDSGSDCSLETVKGNKDLNTGDDKIDTTTTTYTSSAPSITSPPQTVLTSTPIAAAASPATVVTRSILQNAPLLVNGNNLLTATNNIMTSLGTIPSILGTPLVQTIPQTQTPVSKVVAALRPPAPTPSPVTITVRTPPGTGALSQSLISNIVNTPEVQALLSKNPGQPITIVRVPDAPAPTCAPGVVPAQSTATAPPPAPPVVNAPASTLTPSTSLQTATIPILKTVTNVISKPQPTATLRTFPTGSSTAVLSNRLVDSSGPTKPTTSSPANPVPTSTGAAKPQVLLGVRKRVSRGGKINKGMAPAVPSSQDLNLLRQKRPANCKTRSGRVSRPPLYRIKEYKTMPNEELGDQRGSSEGEYSDYDDSESGTPSTGSTYDSKRRHKCQSCEKRYIGKGGLARHYRENPTHGDPDSVLKKADGEDKQTEVAERIEKSEEETAADVVSAGKSNGDTGESSHVADQASNDHVNEKPGVTPIAQSLNDTPRGVQLRPRGRGRGRPGRPPGSGRRMAMDQDADSGVLAASSQDASSKDYAAAKTKYKFFDPNSPLDDDLTKVTLPMLAKIISPWEYILAQAQQTDATGLLFPKVLSAIEALQAEAKKIAPLCLRGISKEDSTPSGNGTVEKGQSKLYIGDKKMAEMLGMKVGWYHVSDPAEEELPRVCRLLRRKSGSAPSSDSNVPESSKEARGEQKPVGKHKLQDAEESVSKRFASGKSLPSSSPATKTITIAKSVLSTPSTSIPTIGNIPSILDVPSSSTTASGKQASKRPIPPLGPISSTKGFDTKETSVTTVLPALKPIKSKPATSQSGLLHKSQPQTNTTTTPAVSSPVMSDSTYKAKSGLDIASDDNLTASSVAVGEGDVISGVDGLMPKEKAPDATETAAETSSGDGGGGGGLVNTVEPSGDDLVEQTTVLPEGTTIMQLEDGTFLLQKPDGTAMQIQTPEGMTIETVQALLSMEGGAFETVEEPQYMLDDGSCVQLPAGMSLDMAVEMGLLNQAGSGN
ncbi:uncharacterized protein [Diadema antillarum]|uniref:uncharacterized protein n=1 Tax=Diadema antillarum TaxID=105358 RepID=UPI003A842FAC